MFGGCMGKNVSGSAEKGTLDVASVTRNGFG
jgi:hypothetical protein